MDATQRVVCNGDLINPLFTLGVEMSCILVLSHFFHLVLKPFGQPGPIAQILAGFVVGGSGLSRIKAIRDYFFQVAAADYYQTLALFSRILFMFLIGLETDVPTMVRNLRPAMTVCYSSGLSSCIFAAAISPFIYHQINSHTSKLTFVIVLMMIIGNTASPVVTRLAAELKLATSDIGQLAISSSLISDLSCLIVLALMTTLSKGGSGIWERIKAGFLCIILIVAIIFLNKHASAWLNQRNRNQKYLKNAEVFCILSLLFATSMFIELMGYNSIITSFLLGVMFPKQGKAARTLIHKLTYPIHTFVLPMYFGFTGFQADISQIKNIREVLVIFLVVLSSIGGKIGGTLIACRYLKIPMNEGIVLAILMNLKGHVDLLLIGLSTDKQKWNGATYSLFLVTVVINTVIVGPIVALIVRKERNIFTDKQVSLELQNPDNELRVLACVHGPRHVPAMVGLIAASNTSKTMPITAYLMHLIELPEKTRANLMYHELEDDDFSDVEDYGGNDVLEINDAVDAFITEKGIMVRQVKCVSPYATMYEDVCNGAEDIRASIIILPFHKHQRIDGKMESGKEGTRTTNQKVLRHAPCSVAILVDRALPGVPRIPGEDTVQHIAALFFGGPDDREALAYGIRIGMHPHVNLTVVKFTSALLSKSRAGINVALDNGEEVLMAMSSHETDCEADSAFLADFYNRYVTSGKVGYIEKIVDNGAETATALRDMGDMYSLFIVGKGKRGLSPLTTGMSDWEECPELGRVGDLLASSDFEINGSVLIIQQHRRQSKDLIDDELLEM